MNVFSDVTSVDFGALTSANIVQSGVTLLTLLAPIILIGIAIAFAPKLIAVVKYATGTRYFKNWKDLESTFTKNEKKYSDMFMKGRGRDYTIKDKDIHAQSIVKKKGLFG